MYFPEYYYIKEYETRMSMSDEDLLTLSNLHVLYSGVV